MFMSRKVGECYLGSNLKPAMEFCIAAGITPPAAVAMALGASAFYLENHISPIFIQERLGQAMEPIEVVKLRTFPFESDQADRSGGDDDPRATRIGKLLRKAKIDDLAMLWNFFKGDVALVGPRPVVSEEIEATYEVLSQSERTDWERARNIAKAGSVSSFNQPSRQLDPTSDAYLRVRAETDIVYVFEKASASVDLAILADAIGGAAGRLVSSQAARYNSSAEKL